LVVIVDVEVFMYLYVFMIVQYPISKNMIIFKLI